MEKKIKKLSIRTDGETHRMYKARADAEGCSVSALVSKALSDYINRDLNVQDELLVASSKVISDVERLRRQEVITYNMLFSLARVLFCAFPSYMAYGLEDDAPAGGDIDAHQKAGSVLVKKWQRKFSESRQMVQANLAEMESRINAERR